jgi:hypothetical protein
MKLLKETIRAMLKEDAQDVFWRVQPKGKGVLDHTSGLAFEKVDGIFAFTDPSQLFDTYTWIHVRKSVDDYEMVTLTGTIVDRPDDSEGVVIRPEAVLSREPLGSWLASVS